MWYLIKAIYLSVQYLTSIERNRSCMRMMIGTTIICFKLVELAHNGNVNAEKVNAQRMLKYFHERDVLFTANDLILEGISKLQNKSPQQYFPTCNKAEIIEDLSKRKK
jgi:hypothetical protein